MINLAISGCQGRMGQRITHLALQDNAFKITALLEHNDHPKATETIQDIKINTTPDAVKASDTLIEFTTPQATLDNLNACVTHGVKMVIGTTGFTPEQTGQIQKAAETIPIVFASNMSIGVNILFKLAQQLAETAPDAYSVKILEAHHVHKKDAPSGTAKTLASMIESHSERKVTDIESKREGEIVGDHTVIFESPEDTITIDHHAKNRDIFAKGALVAAKFLAGKDKGLFSMQDVLGLS